MRKGTTIGDIKGDDGSLDLDYASRRTIHDRCSPFARRLLEVGANIVPGHPKAYKAQLS